jgi:DNA-binding IclR family transcriptional regulator
MHPGHPPSHPNHPYNRPSEGITREIFAVIVERLALTGEAPTAVQISKQVNLGDATVNLYIKRLVSRGWLRSERVRGKRRLSLPLPDRVAAKLAVIFRLANAELDDLADDQRRELIMQMWHAKAARQERKAS